MNFSDSIEAFDNAGQPLVGLRHAGICDRPAAVVLAGTGGNGAALVVPAGDAVVSTGEVGIALAALHAWARVLNSESTLARGAARNYSARYAVPLGHVVLGVPNAWVAWISH